jgi:hypothetical protein
MVSLGAGVIALPKPRFAGQILSGSDTATGEVSVRPRSPGGLIFGLKVATRDQPFPGSLFDRLEPLQQLLPGGSPGTIVPM